VSSWQQGEESGTIAADIVVNCGGMWGRDLAAQSGVTLPLHACEHFYIVTEAIEGLTAAAGAAGARRVRLLQGRRRQDDARRLRAGGQALGHGRHFRHFCFDQLPEDFDHFEPILEQAVNRLPMLAAPASTPSSTGPRASPRRPPIISAKRRRSKVLGRRRLQLDRHRLAGGAGIALAQWMNDGETPFDLWEVDIRRWQPFQGNRHYLQVERVTETLGLLYADHFPYRQMATARGVRRSPIHEHLKARGAVFGEVAGWERANWFADEGQAREYRYSWKRQNWFDNQKREHHGRARAVGLFDMTSFGKIRVEGRDALAFLQRLCANDMDVEPGRIVYTQMLNTRGGIECDLTVTRLSETAFLLVVPGATLQRDLSLAQAASRRRIRGDHRCDGSGSGALRDGAERAVADAGRQPE
jgi:hypothetical protein